MKKRDWTLLFSELDLRALLEGQLPGVKRVVDALDPSRILNESAEDLTEEVRAESVIARLDLLIDDISIDHDEVKVDVSQVRDRMIRDRSQPFYVDGMRVTYFLPYRGDKELLRARPSSFTLNPPRAVVTPGELQFPYERTDNNLAATRPEFDRDLSTLQQWVGWVNAQVDEYNGRLPAIIGPLIAARKSKLSEGRQQIDSLGFKVRAKTGPAAPADDPPPARPAVAKGAPATGSANTPKYDVALSYAGEDRAYVERVATSLKTHGINVFYDQFETVDMWGKNLADHFAEVFTRQARFVVMFVSADYARKAWPTYERQQAQARAIKSQETVILPVRLDDTEIPGLGGVATLDGRTITPAKLAEIIEAKVKR